MPRRRHNRVVIPRKTAVEALRELLARTRETPGYECILVGGSCHFPMYEYLCVVGDDVTNGEGLSNKSAKQDAARKMLVLLAEKGYPVPWPWCSPENIHQNEIPGRFHPKG